MQSGLAEETERLETGFDWAAQPVMMTIPQTAKFLGTGYRCILNLCHTEGFPAMKLGRVWMVSREGLKRFIERQTETGV